MVKQSDLRDKVISLKLTKQEHAQLSAFASRYGIPPSTLVYLIIKDRLHNFDETRNPDLGFL